VAQDTDRDWNALAEIDPYWAVLTHDEFRGAVATDRDRLNAFLESGREHVDRIWGAIETAHGGPFSPGRALDFGCGVGRVAIPLAARCGSVVGVDVADSMLARARELADRLGARNVQFVREDDDLALVGGTFDLVHSYIVFQHIAPKRGLRLLRVLASRLDDNGVGVLHVLYYNPDMASTGARLVKTAWRTLKRPFRQRPQMQMNAYPLGEVLRIIHEAGSGPIQMLPTDHGGCLGAILCFRRDSERKQA
jgi:SAM-dependent methyltransferase